MGIPCVCGCTLQTGTKIIGWVSFGLNALQTLAIVGAIELYISQKSSAGAMEWAILITVVTISSFGAVFAIVLLYGNEQGRAGLTIPWMIIQFLATCIYVASLINGLRGGFDASMIISIHIILIYIFMLLTVHGRYQEIKNGNNQNSTSRAVPVREGLQRENRFNKY